MNIITTPDGKKWAMEDGCFTLLNKNLVPIDTLSHGLFDAFYPNFVKICNPEQTDL